MKKEIVSFKTNTLLKNLIGKDLINDDNIAIFELVKNSYDASAKNIKVIFEKFSEMGETKGESQIIVSDDGTGMSLSDLKNKWLNIAYSDKKEIQRRTGIKLAGNKGIGRFSCDRLGEKLDLLTRKNSGEIFHLKINWPDFERENEVDLQIQDINLTIISISESDALQIANIKKFPNSGTILVISKLRSNWNQKTLTQLKRALEKLINPNQEFIKKKFNIFLIVPDIADNDKGKIYSNKITGKIKNQIFKNLQFRTTYIESSISLNGKTTTYLLYHDGEKVFELVEKNLLFKELKGTRIYIYFLNAYKKGYFKRQTGITSIDFGSIFLFLNGFRIPPYGNRNNDWLGLDIRRNQGTARYLATRDIVGRIEISGNDGRFTPVSSREGLINSPAVIQLKENYFLNVLRKLEKFVVDGLGWDSVNPEIRKILRKSDGLDWNITEEIYEKSWEAKKKKIISTLVIMLGVNQKNIIKFWFNPSLLEGIYEENKETLTKLFGKLDNIDSNPLDSSFKRKINKIKNKLLSIEKEAQSAKEDAQKLREEILDKEELIETLEKEQLILKGQTKYFQNISSLDVDQLLTYHHQINQDSTIINNYLDSALRNISTDNTDIIEFLQKASFINKRVLTISQYAIKANFHFGTKKEKTDIPLFIEQYLNNIAKNYLAAGINLRVHNTISEPFEISASRVDLSILVDNIISNSNKSKSNNLSVKMFINKGNLFISFSDDGLGISNKITDIDSIFEKGVSTTRGSGLGLFQARNIINDLGGNIIAKNNDLKGLEILIEVKGESKL